MSKAFEAETAKNEKDAAAKKAAEEKEKNALPAKLEKHNAEAKKLKEE